PESKRQCDKKTRTETGLRHIAKANLGNRQPNHDDHGSQDEWAPHFSDVAHRAEINQSQNDYPGYCLSYERLKSVSFSARDESCDNGQRWNNIRAMNHRHAMTNPGLEQCTKSDRQNHG